MTDPIVLASRGHTQTATSEAIVRGINEPTRKSIVRTASSATLLLLFLTGYVKTKRMSIS